MCEVAEGPVDYVREKIFFIIFSKKIKLETCNLGNSLIITLSPYMQNVVKISLLVLEIWGKQILR